MLATIHDIRSREIRHRARPPVLSAPRSESLAAYRKRIARVIDANGPAAWHLIEMVKIAKAGADPESALVYLQQLRDSLDAVLEATLPR